MAIIVYTDKVTRLMVLIRRKFTDDEIPTWTWAKDGFVHTADSGQWEDVGIVSRSKTRYDDGVVFNVVSVSGHPLTQSQYAALSGRFASMLISHFSHRFSALEITAVPSAEYGDDTSVDDE